MLAENNDKFKQHIHCLLEKNEQLRQKRMETVEETVTVGFSLQQHENPKQKPLELVQLRPEIVVKNTFNDTFKDRKEEKGDFVETDAYAEFATTKKKIEYDLDFGEF